MAGQMPKWLGEAVAEQPELRMEHLPGSNPCFEALYGALPGPGKDIDWRFAIVNRQCFCLFGPQGCGKRTMARAFAGSLMEIEPDCRLLCATGDMLQQANEEKTAARVRELFAAVKKDTMTCVILENLSRGDGVEALWTTVAQACGRLAEDTRLRLLIIEDNESVIRQEWCRNIQFFRFRLPNAEERTQFFGILEGYRQIKRAMENAREPMTFDWMAEQTEGMNYIQLERLIATLGMREKAQLRVQYHNNVNNMIRALTSGSFAIDQAMFLEAVQLVRDQPENMTAISRPAPMQVVVQGMPAQTMVPVQQVVPNGGQSAVNPESTVTDPRVIPQEKRLEDELNKLFGEDTKMLEEKGIL